MKEIRIALPLLILLIAATLQGCGGATTRTNTHFVRTEAFTDYDKPETVAVSMDIQPHTSGPDTLQITMGRTVRYRKFEKDILKEDTIYETEPDVLMGALGLVLSPVAIVLGDGGKHVDSVGNTLAGDEQTINSVEKDANLRATGEYEHKDLNDIDTGSVEIFINDVAAASYPLNNQGTLLIDVKELLGTMESGTSPYTLKAELVSAGIPQTASITKSIHVHGVEYEGPLAHGKPHGYGSLHRGQSGTLSGNFADGRWAEAACAIRKEDDWLLLASDCNGEWATGYGRAETIDSSQSFEGEFLDGYFSAGRYTTGTTTYEGTWENGQLHGMVLVVENGATTYKGNYVNGVRHGQGLCDNEGTLVQCSYNEGERNDPLYLAQVEAKRMKAEYERKQAELLAEMERERHEAREKEREMERERKRQEEERERRADEERRYQMQARQERREAQREEQRINDLINYMNQTAAVVGTDAPPPPNPANPFEGPGSEAESWQNMQNIIDEHNRRIKEIHAQKLADLEAQQQAKQQRNEQQLARLRQEQANRLAAMASQMSTPSVSQPSYPSNTSSSSASTTTSSSSRAGNSGSSFIFSGGGVATIGAAQPRSSASTDTPAPDGPSVHIRSIGAPDVSQGSFALGQATFTSINDVIIRNCRFSKITAGMVVDGLMGEITEKYGISVTPAPGADTSSIRNLKVKIALIGSGRTGYLTHTSVNLDKHGGSFSFDVTGSPAGDAFIKDGSGNYYDRDAAIEILKNSTRACLVSVEEVPY